MTTFVGALTGDLGVPDYLGQGAAGVSRNKIYPLMMEIYFEHNLNNQSLPDLSIYKYDLNKMNRL